MGERYVGLAPVVRSADYRVVMDVDAYLERIGYAGVREPSERTLCDLHRAHMLAVPFENLDIHLGVANVLDPEHVFDKIVTRRRGGWCYELNGLFALLLESLGFAVTRYSASVVLSDPPSPDFAHLTLRVDLDRPWLADVGFGASFTRPLRLDDDGDQERDGNAYRVTRGPDGRMILHENGTAQYAFALEPRRMEQFSEMCVLQQTSPTSHFLHAPMCSRATEDGRLSLSGMRLITTTDEGRSERELETEADRTAVLRELFGVDLAGRTLVPSSTSPE
jgi:N-hydroxyarylamine O-acetyltransferase